MADTLAGTKTASKKAEKENRKSVLEGTVKNNTKEISQWKDTKITLYGQYRDGKITKEEYMARMEKGKTRLLELEQEKEEAQKELDGMVETGRTGEAQEEELSELSVLETFDKEKIQMLADKVFVYGSDEIEIVWKTRNPFE